MSVIASEQSERGDIRDHFAVLVMTDALLVMTSTSTVIANARRV
jgi:hypothetical protein